MQNTLRAVSQPLGLNEGLNSTIRSAVNSRIVRAMMRNLRIRLFEILDRVTMQLFVRGDYAMIATPVQRDVDGIPKGSHDVLLRHQNC